MDPLSAAGTIIGIVAVALQAAKTAHDAVERFRGRDKAMAQLSAELSQLVNILVSAEEAASLDEASLAFLRKPIEHCSRICVEFKDALNAFSRRSSMGLKDWARMEFKRGTLTEFTDTLAGYKSTLQIGLGVVVMRTTKQTQTVLEQYNELIENTNYNLEMQLLRIHERIDSLGPGADAGTEPNAATDLNDERAVTQQCLQICQEAATVLQRFQQQQPALQAQQAQAGGAGPSGSGSQGLRAQFEAQVMTKNALADSQARLVDTLNSLQDRLNGFLTTDSVNREREWSRLQQDLDVSKQCLEVCSMASNMSTQKIHIIGEVIADDDTDQIVVTTLADMFDVKKVVAKNNSAQLVGSMNDESLQKVAQNRYRSRFGAVPSPRLGPNTGDATQPATGAPSPSPAPAKYGTATGLGQELGSKPSTDEIRQFRVDYAGRSR